MNNKHSRHGSQIKSNNSNSIKKTNTNTNSNGIIATSNNSKSSYIFYLSTISIKNKKLLTKKEIARSDYTIEL